MQLEEQTGQRDDDPGAQQGGTELTARGPPQAGGDGGAEQEQRQTSEIERTQHRLHVAQRQVVRLADVATEADGGPLKERAERPSPWQITDEDDKRGDESWE